MKKKKKREREKVEGVFGRKTVLYGTSTAVKNPGFESRYQSGFGGYGTNGNLGMSSTIE